MIYEIELLQDEATPFELVQTCKLFFVEFANDAAALGFINGLESKHKFAYQLVFRRVREKGKNGRLYQTHEHDELKEFLGAYLRDDDKAVARLESTWDDDLEFVSDP